jgi:hypothetical protein
MNRRSRITLLLIIAILLIAAILASIPGDSPFKVPSILLVSIIGTLSALAQFTGTDAFRRLVRESISKPNRVSPKQLLRYLADQHLLLRCEAIGRQPIYQLDNDYWTNLILDFSKLVHDPNTLDWCAICIRPLLFPKLDRGLVVEPLDLGQSQTDVRQALAEIITRLSGQIVRAKEIHNVGQVAILVGIFSPQTRNFLLQEGEHIASAVFLIGPDSQYLSKTFKNLSFKATSIVSTDTLQELDLGIRRSILWYPH